MANFAVTFKNEVVRIARKELRQSVGPIRKQLAAQRRDIAALKRERDQLKRDIAAIARTTSRSNAPATDESDNSQRMRFSAAGLQSLRQKLGISAEDFGQLAGVSNQSVYNWEHGKTRPRAAQLQQIAALRGIGKREAQARLEALRKPKRTSRST